MILSYTAVRPKSHFTPIPLIASLLRRLGPALLLIAAALVIVSPAQAGPYRFYLEAEDCDGIQRYPYDNEGASGWYAREATTRGLAGSRGYMAAIHETASDCGMSKALDQPIPAGKYRVFLRTLGPVLVKEDTVVTVGIGDATAAFRYKGAKRVDWTKGLDVTLTQPATKITFTATQFGGMGAGAVFEPLHRSIWLDTLYITSDLSETKPPTMEAEASISGGFDPATLPPRPKFASDDDGPYDPVTPEPLAPVVKEPIKLQAQDGRANLWPNGSFELGMNDGWTGDTTARTYVFTDSDLDASNPFHGTYSLHVPAGVRPFSRQYFLPAGGPMTLSLYVRGSSAVQAKLLRIVSVESPKTGKDRQVKTEDALVVQGQAAAEWQRLSGSATLKNGWYYLVVQAVKDKASGKDKAPPTNTAKEFWIDGLQLEAGTAPTAFAPRAGLEGALRSGQLGNILYDNQRTLLAYFHNSDSKPVKARLQYRIVDFREAVVAEGTTDDVDVPPSGTVSTPVTILPPLRGMFSVTYAIAGRPLYEGETIYAVVPPPSKGDVAHTIGGNMSFDPFELAVQSRLGVRSVLTCKSRQVGSAAEGGFGGHPKPDVWQWYDDLAARPAKYNLDLITCMWPSHTPTFMQQPIPQPYRCNRGNTPRNVPKIDLWKEYAGKLAAHYQPYVKMWCIDDEAENNWDPVHYVPFVQETVKSARAAAPNVKLGLSGTPEYLEELFALGLDTRDIDWLGGSFFDYEYWASLRVRALRERMGKPACSYGVGGRPPSRSMYHTSRDYLPVRGTNAYVAKSAINQILIQGNEISGHYAAVIRNDGIHDARNKPLLDYDGSPLPWGMTYVTLGTLLADAEYVETLDLGATGRYVVLFQLGDRLAAVTYSTAIKTSDRQWRTAQRVLAGLSLPCPKDSVELADIYWNPHPATWDNDRLVLDLNEEPVFFFNRTLSPQDFRALFTSATLPPQPCGLSMELVRGDSGTVTLRITAENRTDQPLNDVLLDLRKPASGKGPWNNGVYSMLPQPATRLKEIPAGGKTVVELPTLLDGHAPLDSGNIRVNLKTADGFETAADDSLWLLPSMPQAQPPALDGKLGEWENHPASWLFCDFAWGQIGRGITQVFDGAGCFSYPSYRLDARAAVWSGHDADTLYLAVRLEDDQPILSGDKSETLRVVLNSPSGPLSLILTPRADGTVTIAPADANATELAQTAQARCALLKQTIVNGSDLKKTPVTFVGVELAVPLKLLAAQAKAGDLLGFDLYWTDVDLENGKPVAGTLRWAGDAARLGYLMLK